MQRGGGEALVYTVLIFDGFRLTGGDQFAAEDEAEAILKSLRRAGGSAFELWRPGARLQSFPAATRQPTAPPAREEPAKAPPEPQRRPALARR